MNWFYLLDRCCQVQLLTDAAAEGRGGETVKISEEALYTRGIVEKGGNFGGNMMFGLIDEVTQKKYLQ